MSILPIEKFIILTKKVAKLTKIFMGKKANLVKFIWFVKYLFNVFAADLNLRKNVFQIDMPPSFLLWRIDFSEFKRAMCRLLICMIEPTMHGLIYERGEGSF